MSLRKVIDARTTLLEQEQKLYTSAITQINSEMKGLLTNNFGSKLINNCGRDLAGELVRNFFDTSDYYVTADQLMERILKFKYDSEYDPLMETNALRKSIFNYNDLESSTTLVAIMNDLESSKQKLFEKEKFENENGKLKSHYKDRNMIHKGKLQYRSDRHANGTMKDDYTDKTETSKKNSRGEQVSQLHVEHTQALSTAYVYNRYLKEGAEERIKEFYNSSDNFTMMFKTANQSKGDVKVEVNVKVKDSDGVRYEKIDITHKATSHQIAEAIENRWTHLPDEAKKKMKEAGYLDDEGKVPKHVKAELVKNYRRSQNAESKKILKETDYKKVSKDAAKHTAKSLGKMLAGQVIYYTVPPLIYELRMILQDKKVNLKEALHKLEKAGERVVKYVFSKLGTIFNNLVSQGLKKFLKSFFDILLNVVKSTIQKMLKLLKNLVLAVVDAAKVIGDKLATPSQKADSVFQLLSVSVTSFVLELLFEYVERQFAIPEPLLLPLQVITTVICTNLIMLVLEHADLFNVRHGLLLTNIQQVIQRENQLYIQSIGNLSASNREEAERKLQEVAAEIEEAKLHLQRINPHTDSVQEDLQKINTAFDMNIDFEKEWKTYLGVV
ncbi:hypothetical protein [Paenibacillus piscarius]|uniref:hypothetical protein n=1 Tax=Paenibacillus piscarius TaxID=1089681 RepID=UPI001EE7A6DA|nr:hypothetical protein [Paenibacillus piscarius]